MGLMQKRIKTYIHGVMNAEGLTVIDIPLEKLLEGEFKLRSKETGWVMEVEVIGFETKGNTYTCQAQVVRTKPKSHILIIMEL